MHDVQRWLGLADVNDQSHEPGSEADDDPHWVRLLRRLGVAGQLVALLLVCSAGGAAGTLLVDVAAATFTAGRNDVGLAPDTTGPCWRVRERAPADEPLRA